MKSVREMLDAAYANQVCALFTIFAAKGMSEESQTRFNNGMKIAHAAWSYAVKEHASQS